MRFRYFIKNEKGIALVMVLVLSAISLAIMSVLVFMIISGTKISGKEKRYLNALEAAHGVREDVAGGVTVEDNDNTMLAKLKDGGFNPANYKNFYYSPSSSSACIQQKINSNASAPNWSACGSFATMLSKINQYDPTTYDFSFDVPATNSTHKAYIKIFDTMVGNTVRKILRTGSVVSPRGSQFTSPAASLYSFEVLTVNLTNSVDRARLFFLFAQ